jgi:hypothetical protein
MDRFGPHGFLGGRLTKKRGKAMMVWEVEEAVRFGERRDLRLLNFAW